MKFEQYKTLARKVFPDLSEDWETKTDCADAYVYLIQHLPQDVAAYDHFTDSQRADLFSVHHMTMLQLRHLNQFGRTYWDK